MWIQSAFDLPGSYSLSTRGLAKGRHNVVFELVEDETVIATGGAILNVDR